MTRRPVATQAAISRVVKAARAAGVQIDRVEVEGIKIAVYSSEAVQHQQEPTSEYDRWRMKRDAR